MPTVLSAAVTTGSDTQHLNVHGNASAMNVGYLDYDSGYAVLAAHDCEIDWDLSSGFVNEGQCVWLRVPEHESVDRQVTAELLQKLWSLLMNIAAWKILEGLHVQQYGQQELHET